MSAPRTVAPYAGDPFAAVIAELRAIRQALEARGVAGQPRSPNAPWAIDEAAAHLHVSPRHLRNLIKNGSVQGLKLGKRVLLPASEVERLSQSGA